MIRFFKRKKESAGQPEQPASPPPPEPSPLSEPPAEGSAREALLAEAESRGWVKKGKLGAVPEIMGPLEDASREASGRVQAATGEEREALLERACRHLFARGVEGVVLWGHSRVEEAAAPAPADAGPDEFETAVPDHLREVVLATREHGTALFTAHAGWVRAAQAAGLEFDVERETGESLLTVSRLGVHYALKEKLHMLR